MTLCETLLKNATLEIADAIYEALTPPPPRTVLDWVESEDGPWLSERTSGISGKLDLSVTPYLRFPLKMFNAPGVERMGLCFGTQSGKTTFLECIVGYIIDHDPGPTMFLRPTMKEAEDFSKDRMIQFIVDCPSLSRHVLGKFEDSIKNLEYKFDRMTLRYAWSQSEVSVRGHPIRYLIKDESSAYAPGASALADERTKTFWNRKIIETSTPKQDTDTIWRLLGLKRRTGIKPEEVFSTASYSAESATSVYFHRIPCPHCHQFIRLEATQLRWPKDCPLREIEARGWYECQLCGGRITDGDKAFALQRGEWHTDNPGGKWIGCHLNSMYAPWTTTSFGAVAFEMINARRSNDYEVMKSFVNNWLALPYSLEDLGSDVITLTSVENSKHIRYLKNEVPSKVRALSIGADVQGDRIYWVVLGWNVEQREATELREAETAVESWVISWGECADFDAFGRDVVQKVWNHASGVQMCAVCGAMDGRFRTAEVKDFVKKFPVMNVAFGEQTIKNKSAASTSAIPFTATAVDRDSRGKPLINSRIGYRVNTVYWKQWLYQRINRIGEAIVFHLPTDDTHDGKTFIRHISSEVEVAERVRGSTEIRRVWKVRKGYEDNHWLDATVYGSAIANIKGVFGMRPDHEILGNVTPVVKQETEQQKMRPRLFERRQI